MVDYIALAKEKLKSLSAKSLSQEERVEEALLLAELLQKASLARQTRHEKAFARELEELLKNPQAKAFVVDFAEQVFRSCDPSRSVSQMRYLINKYGIPSGFSWSKKIGLALLKHLGGYFPSLSLFFAKQMIKAQTKNVIISAERS